MFKNHCLFNFTHVLFFLIIVFNLSLSAQDDYLYENISVADGLSSSSFNPFQNIYQDQFGFMWIGTTDGLNRYDGYDFVIYKNIPGDSTSLPNSNIQTINEDADGNLWIGTFSRMSMFNREENNFTTFPIDQSSNTTQQDVSIFRSFVDSKNNFWITTQGRSAQKWNNAEKKWEIVPVMMQVEGVDTLVKSSSSPAVAINELKNGNLLISTFNGGIYYYNESRNLFEPFNFAGNSIPIGIVDIFEDRGGNIWLSGRECLIEYNPKSFSFDYKTDLDRFKSIAGEAFYFNINELEDGNFLLISIPHGIIKFDRTTEKFEIVKIGGELEQRGVGKFAFNKFIDKFGVYWIGLADNGILKFDPNRKPFRHYTFPNDNPNQTVRPLTADVIVNKNNTNEIIISTDRYGFFKFDIEKRAMEQINVPVSSIYTESANALSIVLDEHDKLWFSNSANSISSYNLKSGKSETFKILKDSMNTGGNEFIRRLEYIPKNKLIISSTIGGYIFNTVTNEIEELPTTMNRKYSDQFIEEIKKTIETNEVVVSMIRAGESVELTQNLSIEKETDFLIVCMGEGQHPNGMFDYGGISKSSGETVWAMDEINKSFHAFGGYKNRLSIQTVKLQPGNYTTFFKTDVGHSYDNFNVNPPFNPEWYGIQVIKINPENIDELNSLIDDEKKNNNAPDAFSVTNVLSSRKYPSDLWLGVNSLGLIRYDLTSGKFNQFPLEIHNTSSFTTDLIFEDSKGRLWITLAPAGFYRFIPEKGEFISNASIPDLPNAGINGITEDFQGGLWISTTGGITKLTEHEDGSWSTSNYDSKDGVTGGFGRGAVITNDGEILLGTFNGLTAFFPSSENTSEPIPVISNINISDKSVIDADSEIKLNKSIYEIDQLDLSYVQNDVSFEFSSLHFSRPSKNRVSYKLEGFNEDWIFTDKNFASFTNLDPGKYTLKIKAYSGFGVPSFSERSLVINIAPPWYRTTLAYIAYGFLFVGLIFGIDRLQRHRLLRKERERQKIQEAELRAIAAEAQARAAEAENERKSRELEEARQLQLSMLPKKLPVLPNLDIAVYMKTATEVGGDYYDFHVGIDGTLTVVVGDATGHGMKAGTMVTAAKSLFSTHAANPDILFTFSEISRCIKHMDMHLLTMCMTVLKIQQNKMRMSAAGMPPTLLFRNETKQLEEITIKGMPLGAVEKFPYSMRETELNVGDTIFLMSDGFPELFNEEKEMYGYERVQNEFQKVADRKPEEIINRLKSNASEWIGGGEPNDDITFVVIKVK
ncbi:MAG: SpoIIE family protein phosphatase [Melioribacteraceae bacterium]|nr:SpoIIE family protein phosphatase [Melioribacteraceae bacterium]